MTEDDRPTVDGESIPSSVAADDNDPPDLDAALDGIHAAVRYASARDLPVARRLAACYQALGEQSSDWEDE